MTFTDPIIGGQSKLIRSAIQSPNYVPGVSGWTINRDGSYELGPGGSIRGDVLITDPDGSYIHIYDENPGDGTVIEMGLPTSIGATRTPGIVRSGITPTIGPEPGMEIVSPTVDGTPIARIALVANTTFDISEIFLSSTDVYIDVESGVAVRFGPGGGNFTVEGAASLVDCEGFLFVSQDAEVIGELNASGGITAVNHITLDGVPVLRGDVGTELVTFAAATTFLQSVNYPVAFPVGVVPNVTVNIASAAGVTRWFKVRADTFTNTGFRIVGDTTDAAAPAVAWTNIPVTWVASVN